MKTRITIFLLAAAILTLPFIAGHLFGQSKQKVVAVLEPIAIHIVVPENDEDEVAKAFYGELQYEMKKTGRFILVTENQDRNCVILHSTIRIICGTPQVTHISGYAAAVTMVTKQGPDLRVSTYNVTSASMREVAHLAAKKIFVYLTGEELEDKPEDK